MKIQTIQNKNLNNCKSNSTQTYLQQTSPMQAPSLILKQNNSHLNKILSFFGYNVKLLDGGQHSKDLYYFAKALNSEMDIERIEVATNSKDSAVKQMLSLKQKLEEINNLPSNKKPEYLAMPILCCVPLLNLSDQMKSVTKKISNLTPENIKSKQSEILSFFKTISDKPYENRSYIGYMDKIGQGFEHVYGVIQEINKAVKSGIKVFVPAGHPEYDTLKWLAGERGLKPEFYNFISTGEDVNQAISKIKKELQSKNWYDFNLLTLSDATSVNLKDIHNQDHVYAAYDSCVKDGARGVFNFTPIREHGKVVGFSFLDKKSLQYPIADYGNNESVHKLIKYVGLPVNELLASPELHSEFKKALLEADDLTKFENKIFLVKNIFSKNEILTKKLNLRGDYVDSSLKLFFKKNKDGEVIFPNCDYEKSGRPSVVSMWGSCFSTIQSISDHINNNKLKIEITNPEKFENLSYNNLITEAQVYKNNGDSPYFEGIMLQDALKIKKNHLGDRHQSLIDDYDNLADNLIRRSRYDDAENCYNEALNIAKISFNEKDNRIARLYNRIAFTCLKQKKIGPAEGCLNEALDIYCYNLKEYPANRDQIVEIFKNLGTICADKGKNYESKVCTDAATEIRLYTSKGNEIIQKRANGVRYIV